MGADLNYDFKTDVVLAGAHGVRIYLQTDLSHFTDITASSRVPANVMNGSYLGAWAFDVDLDGDLDVVLGTDGGEPVVLRNNGDNTFAMVRPFEGVNSLVSFASADIDGDGDPDVAMIEKDGTLHVFSNERLGEFRPRAIPQSLSNGRLLAVTAADIDGDGLPDFVVLREDGAVTRLSDRNSGQDWDVAELVKGDPGYKPSANLAVADFDNNGSLDLLVGDDHIYLGGSRGFTLLAARPDVSLPGVVDLQGDGRLDLIGVSRSAAGKPVQLINHGAKNYHWQTIRDPGGEGERRSAHQLVRHRRRN